MLVLCIFFRVFFWLCNYSLIYGKTDNASKQVYNDLYGTWKDKNTLDSKGKKKLLERVKESLQCDDK
jgi:hypothetical protein